MSSLLRIVVGVLIGLLIGSGIIYVLSTNRIGSLESRVSSLQGEISSLQNQVTSLQDGTSSRDARITALGNYLAGNLSLIGQLQTWLVDNLTRNAQLQTQLSTAQQQVTSLRTQLTGNITLLENVTGERDRLLVNNTALEDQVQRLQAEVTSLRQQQSLYAKTSIPKGFSLLSVNTYIDVFDYFNVVGELQYNSTPNAKDVRVDIAMLNAEGYLISADYTYAYINILKNYDKTPFRIYVQNQSTVAAYALTVTWTETSEEPYRMFNVNNIITRIDDFGDLELTGNVKNTGTIQAEYVSIIATFYDTEGKILDIDWVYTTPGTLDPNQTGSFEAELDSRFVNAYGSYRVVVEA